MGIVSFFSSHGSVNHLLALMELASKENIRVSFIFMLCWAGGGKCLRASANYIRMIEEKTRELGVGKVVSIIGRYWSENRPGGKLGQKIEKTYRMLVSGQGTPVLDC